MIPAFLENALALDSIPVPKQDISSDKFTRWGKNDCFWAKCAQRAQKIWNGAKPVQTHPYLTRKKIKGSGLKITVSRSLIIPLRDVNGKIWTLEYITEQGKKFMMKSGLKKGPILFSTVGRWNIHLLSGNDCLQSFLDGKSTKG